MGQGSVGFALDVTALLLLALEARRRNDLLAGATFGLGACGAVVRHRRLSAGGGKMPATTGREAQRRPRRASSVRAEPRPRASVGFW